MPVVCEDAARVLDAHPDVAWPESWTRAIPGKPLPLSMHEKVTKAQAVKYVTGRRRQTLHVAQKDPRYLSTLHPLHDYAIRRDEEAYESLRKPILIPQRYGFQLDVFHAMFYGGDGGGAVRRTVRSGIVISPCGSGKTSIGKHAAFGVRGPTCIVTTTVESVNQWVRCFRDAGVADVRALGRDPTNGVNPERPPSVTITTYTYLSTSHAASKATADLKYETLVALYLWQYDLLIMDEVWTLPADTHLRACAALRTKVRLGLTADERRCDGKHFQIQAFVGPVLYEMTLANARERGIIASTKHRVIEVPVSTTFAALYDAADAERRRMLAVLNPHKITRLITLLDEAATKNKVVVFCDKVSALPMLADVLRRSSRRPFVGTLTGALSKAERQRVIDEVRRRPTCVALFSRVGNAALDVPDIDLNIEVSVVDGAAQQKTQRDGRAQRVCEGKDSGDVVTLVSSGTHEVGFAKTQMEQSRGETEATWETEVAEVAETRKRKEREDEDVPPRPQVGGTASCGSCPWTDEQLATLCATAATRKKRKEPEGVKD